MCILGPGTKVAGGSYLPLLTPRPSSSSSSESLVSLILSTNIGFSARRVIMRYQKDLFMFDWKSLLVVILSRPAAAAACLGLGEFCPVLRSGSLRLGLRTMFLPGLERWRAPSFMINSRLLVPFAFDLKLTFPPLSSSYSEAWSTGSTPPPLDFFWLTKKPCSFRSTGAMILAWWGQHSRCNHVTLWSGHMIWWYCEALVKLCWLNRLDGRWYWLLVEVAWLDWLLWESLDSWALSFSGTRCAEIISFPMLSSHRKY